MLLVFSVMDRDDIHSHAPGKLNGTESRGFRSRLNARFRLPAIENIDKKAQLPLDDLPGLGVVVFQGEPQFLALEAKKRSCHEGNPIARKLTVRRKDLLDRVGRDLQLRSKIYPRPLIIHSDGSGAAARASGTGDQGQRLR